MHILKMQMMIHRLTKQAFVVPGGTSYQWWHSAITQQSWSLVCEYAENYSYFAVD